MNIKLKIPILIVFLTFSIIVFNSCGHIFGNRYSDDGQQGTDGTHSAKKYINITGRIGFSGAVPAEVAEFLRGAAGDSRTAFPELPAKIYYFVKATADEMTDVTGTVAADKKSFSIDTLEVGHEWTVSVCIRDGNTAASKILMSDSYTREFTEEDVILEHTFLLKPERTEGTGIVSLEMGIPDSVTDVKLKCDDGTWPSALDSASLSGSGASKKAVISSSTVPSGSYGVMIQFYNEDGFLLYYEKQEITVFQNMTTSRWYDNGGSVTVKTDGSYELTDATIKDSAQYSIFVGQMNLPTGTVYGSDETGTGSLFAPYATLGKAISYISAINAPDRIYTVFVRGVVEGKTVISSDLSSKMKKLIIEGYSPLGSDGLPLDILDAKLTAAEADGSVITLSAGIPVVIERMCITGGKTTGSGGGIALMAGELTLGDDVLIHSNTAGVSGGGVYVSSGAALCVRGCVGIYGNTGGTTGADRSNVYLPSGKKIRVTGALYSGSGLSARNSNIGITTANVPDMENPVAITVGYGYGADGLNEDVPPGRYFKGDAYGLTVDGFTGEAVLSVSGGGISIDENYKDVTLSADGRLFAPEAASKVVTVSATVTVDGVSTGITAGDGEDEITYSFALNYHGEAVPESYYTVGTNTLTFGSNAPAGNYTLIATGIYKGKTYCTSFMIKIGYDDDLIVVSSYEEAITAISSMTENGKIKITCELSDTQLKDISDAVKALATSNPDIEIGVDLSGVTGITEISYANDFFYECENLVSLSFPSNISSIPAGCLRGCIKLKNLDFPASITSFGTEQVCYLCTALETVTIGGSATADNGTMKVADNVVYSSDGKTLYFYGKKAFTGTFTVPDGVKKIYKWAMCSSKFTNVILPSGIQRIQDFAFSWSDKLQSIEIPDSVIELGRSAFTWCTDLTSVDFNPSIDYMGSSIFSNTGITSIVIPNGVKELGSDFFRYCFHLTTVVLPVSLERIGNNSFKDCDVLETVKYRGSETDKTNLEIQSGNDSLTAATWEYNYTGN